LHKESMIAL